MHPTTIRAHADHHLDDLRRAAESERLADAAPAGSAGLLRRSFDRLTTAAARRLRPGALPAELTGGPLPERTAVARC